MSTVQYIQSEEMNVGGFFIKKRGGHPALFLSFVMYDFVWIFIRFALTQGTKKWGKKKTVLVIFYSSKE